MIPIAAVLVTCSSVAAFSAGWQDTEEIPATDPIIGKWKAVKARFDGREFESPRGLLVYEFSTDGTFTVVDGKGELVVDGRFEIEGEGDVRQIRIRPETDDSLPKKDGWSIGIFKTERDRLMRLQLVICVVNQNNQDIPDSFETTEGDRRQLATFEAIGDDLHQESDAQN